ncbi:MAG: hypothetical protein WCH11_07365 [Bdellovibrio sp.]
MNLVFLAAALSGTPKASSERSAPANEALFQVGRQVISTRDVQISALIADWNLYRQILQKKSGVVPPQLKLLEKSEPRFEGQAQRLVVETLLVLEAQQFSLAPLEVKKLQSQAREILASLASQSIQKSQAWTELEILQSLERSSQSQAFMEFLTQSFTLEVSEFQIQQHYEKNRVRFGAFPLKEFRDTIREFLLKEAREARLTDRIESFRKKHRVRRAAQNHQQRLPS